MVDFPAFGRPTIPQMNPTTTSAGFPPALIILYTTRGGNEGRLAAPENPQKNRASGPGKFFFGN